MEHIATFDNRNHGEYELLKWTKYYMIQYGKVIPCWIDGFYMRKDGMLFVKSTDANGKHHVHSSEDFVKSNENWYPIKVFIDEKKANDAVDTIYRR